MLSKEKLPALEAHIDAWAAAENVPQAVIDLVYEMAQENPITPEDKAKCCAEHLWSTDLIGWYDKFIAYITRSQHGIAAKSSGSDLVDDLRAIVGALQQVVNRLEGGNA